MQIGNVKLSFSLCVVAAAVVACGGGGSDDNEPTTPPPPTSTPRLELLAGSISPQRDIACGYVDGVGTSARLSTVTSIVAGTDGSVYAAENVSKGVQCGSLDRSRIRRITAAGNVDTFSVGNVRSPGVALTNFVRPLSLAIDAQNTLYVADGRCIECLEVGGSGETFAENQGVGVWAIGSNGVPRIIAGVTTSTNIGGTIVDGTGLAASFINPFRIVSSTDGRLVVQDNEWTRRITPPNVVTSLTTSNPISAFGLLPNGDVIASKADGTAFYNMATSEPVLVQPGGSAKSLASDSSGNIYYVRNNMPAVIWKLTKGQTTPSVAVGSIQSDTEISLGELPGKLLPVSAISIDAQDRLLISTGYALIKVTLKN